MTREEEEQKEEEDFRAWWESRGRFDIPLEETIRPIDYKCYYIAARAAWSECACRLNLEIFKLQQERKSP